MFPFSIAGVGMVFAGVVLDLVQHWRLFKEVPEIFILVPALLGLKGNLEMTLASRLSTLANLGHLDSSAQRRDVILSNLALIQIQATVIAFLASAFAMALAWIPRGQLDWSHAALLCASSLATACFASLILSVLMALVVVLSRKYNINPDNVATPIAASLGDLTTLAVLSTVGSIFLEAHLTESWLNVTVILVILLISPIWIRLALRDEGTKEVGFFLCPASHFYVFVLIFCLFSTKRDEGLPCKQQLEWCILTRSNFCPYLFIVGADNDTRNKQPKKNQTTQIKSRN
ncbi:unnamed protein product [Heligmosomoides polygyrus]|uniref:MgtE domain-containing protein n=1 Tax=Heligmosomoides polygyrus TaxID=6339 RepID=A0A183GUW6_HELPZ|nr:unnamed protein product [Heligmosomoides polygyrus]